MLRWRVLRAGPPILTLIERPKLQQLPAGPFRAGLRLERRITREGMVSVDGNLYDVSQS